jgi:hypothetical protein
MWSCRLSFQPTLRGQESKKAVRSPGPYCSPSRNPPRLSGKHRSMTAALNLEFSSIKSNARREEIDRNVLASLAYDKAPTIRIHESLALQGPNAVQASLTPHCIPRYPRHPVERSIQLPIAAGAFFFVNPCK